MADAAKKNKALAMATIEDHLGAGIGATLSTPKIFGIVIWIAFSAISNVPP